MKYTREIEGQTFVFEESFWTGKKNIYVDGKALNSLSKNVYQYGEDQVILKGNTLFGLSLTYKGVSTQIVDKITWYDITLHVIFFCFFLIWGSIPALVNIIPIVGGLIGGAISGLGVITSLILSRNKKPLMKILIFLVAFAIVFGICIGIGHAILSNPS